jgi:hypothetical protein
MMREFRNDKEGGESEDEVGDRSSELDLLRARVLGMLRCRCHCRIMPQ